MLTDWRARTSRGCAAIAAGLAASLVAFAPPSTAQEVRGLDAESNARPALPDIDRQFIEYAQANPEDYAGIDALSQKLFGTRYYVLLPGEKEEVTGKQAAAKKAFIDRTSDDKYGILSLPVDTFGITVARSTVSTGVYVTGSVTFKSTYAGQEAPHDVASLQFAAPSCITLSNHGIGTSSTSGATTNVGYLSDANVANKAPIWRINDHTVGFSNQAHRSSAYVLLRKSGCSGSQSISAAHRYEHNKNGSLASISASWGRLSLGYSGSPQTLQKSSSVMNFTM